MPIQVFSLGSALKIEHAATIQKLNQLLNPTQINWTGELIAQITRLSRDYHNSGRCDAGSLKELKQQLAAEAGAERAATEEPVQAAEDVAAGDELSSDEWFYQHVVSLLSANQRGGVKFSIDLSYENFCEAWSAMLGDLAEKQQQLVHILEQLETRYPGDDIIFVANTNAIHISALLAAGIVTMSDDGVTTHKVMGQYRFYSTAEHQLQEKDLYQHIGTELLQQGIPADEISFHITGYPPQPPEGVAAAAAISNAAHEGLAKLLQEQGYTIAYLGELNLAEWLAQPAPAAVAGPST